MPVHVRGGVGAHPRVCGADSRSRAVAGWPWGSSPRVRGRPGQFVAGASERGLIPACAGQTRPPPPHTRSAGAHPRVCRADISVTVSTPDGEGSSPRVQGRRTHPDPRRERQGLIPACAGQTRSAVGCGEYSWAHPRVCRADWAEFQPTRADTGSSPRVQGRRHDCYLRVFSRGLIPSCAGQTVKAGIKGAGAAGSSPRVQGRPPVDAEYQVDSGLIPACAGQTSSVRSSAAGKWAHPRVCRADVVGARSVGAGGGLIPACAGQTTSARCGTPTPTGSSPRVQGRLRAAWRLDRPAWAHPRVCRADFTGRPAGSVARGSSPRVQGRPCSRLSRRLHRGLIPACAGQTSDSSSS